MGAILGLVGLGAVLCFRFPEWLTVPAARALYPVPLIRGLLHLALVSGFGLGVVSLTLRRNKTLGLVATVATVAAALLGGSQVRVEGGGGTGLFLGLDFFLLNLIVYSAVFVPIERLFARPPGQPLFRETWPTDFTYFFVSAVLVQVTTLVTLGPAMLFFDWARVPAVQAWMAASPAVVQFVLIVVVSDLTQYWVHRACHAVPVLWRFHAVHHSADQMDWLAGSRLHLVDIAVTRGLTYVPIYVLGFSEAPLAAYLIFVSAQATFIHANVRFEWKALQWILATPRFHHWHHAAEAEAIDTNFAVHLPALDVLFGTAYLPDRWPSAYGLAHGRRAPRGYLRQFAWPFRTCVRR
jgi:lathosterol oxidase